MRMLMASSAAPAASDWTQSVPAPLLWLVVGMMMLGMLALTIYVFRATFSAAKNVSRSVTGGPADALRELGLPVQRVDVAGGQAQGMWRGMPVTVAWATQAASGGSGFEEVGFVTSVSFSFQPALGIGLQAVEGAGGTVIGDARLDGRFHMGPHMPPAARVRLARAAPAVVPALGRGTLRMSDHGVSLEIPHIVAAKAELGAHLDGMAGIAHALRTP